MTDSNRRSGAYETPEIPLLQSAIDWSEYKDSNLGPHRPKRCALPGCATLRNLFVFVMERDKRIELLTEDWKSAVLPLN